MVSSRGYRVASGSRFAIWNGRGGTDAAVALAAGEVDVAAVTPAASAALMRSGEMLAHAEPRPFLRALGRLPRRDRLVVAVDADLPVQTVADLTNCADRLVIATCPDDGVNMVGFAAHTALRLAGADPGDLVAAGARFDYDERPFPGLQHFADGSANVLVQEAIMTPGGQRIAANRPVRYLDWGDGVTELGQAGLYDRRWPVAGADQQRLCRQGSRTHRWTPDSFILDIRDHPGR
jgi:hypothetical protein